MNVTIVTPTHDPQFLAAAHKYLLDQTETRWVWWISPRRDLTTAQVDVIRRLANDDSRICIGPAYIGKQGNVGAHKLYAFDQASLVAYPENLILLELDHDDLLLPTAVARVMAAFEDPEVGFAYSNAIDWGTSRAAVTYHDPARRAAWEADGWRFSSCEVPGRSVPSSYPLTFEPSAQSLSLIMWAPNHLRAWRASTYREIGGHDPALPVCDDHDLLIRTYLATKMVHIPEPLYVYRVSGGNTWLGRIDEIRRRTEQLRDEHLHALVAREMKLRDLLCLDLGGGINPASLPWISVDHPDHGIYTGTTTMAVDLSVFPWPFPDSSVGAFRAFDFLEHIADKERLMAEVYRCLAPGGWLLSQTPRADGVGADSDPTHVSRWVERSFRYYTDANLSRFLPERSRARFMVGRLGSIDVDLGDCRTPYVFADLVSLKGDDGRLPGRRGI